MDFFLTVVGCTRTKLSENDLIVIFEKIWIRRLTQQISKWILFGWIYRVSQNKGTFWIFSLWQFYSGVQAGIHNQCQVQQFGKYLFLVHPVEASMLQLPCFTSNSSTTKVQPVQIQANLQNTEIHIIRMKSGDISLAGRLPAFFGRCGCRSVWRFRRSHLSLKYVGISFPFVMNVMIFINIVGKIIAMKIVMTFFIIMTSLLPWTSW